MGAVTDGRPGGADDRLLAWPAVQAVTGLSRTTAWRMQKAGDFPLPVLVSKGRVGWWESELAAWKLARAPRRPAEPRLFEATPAVDAKRVEHSRAPRQTAAAGDGLAGGAARIEPERGRKGGKTSPGQIAFDFGS